jgi:folate-dependent phosphoribosylglycinamide formyltransferase PurN
MKEVVILTGAELRHAFVRQAIALDEDIKVLRTYCEGMEGTTLQRAREDGSDVKIEHLERRARSERDFFGHFVELVPDESNPVEITRGDINDERFHEEITGLDPDLLVAYGCSIIRDPLLSTYQGRFLNVHLGLSPYYRGTGTNFWPLVNGEPEFVGATFMHLDEGVDTGAVLHQQRGRVNPGDTPHQIGNRLISDMMGTYREVIRKFEDLETAPAVPEPEETHYYEQSDYSEAATKQLYEQFESGMIETYLANRDERIADAPIAKNPAIESSPRDQ